MKKRKLGFVPLLISTLFYFTMVEHSDASGTDLEKNACQTFCGPNSANQYLAYCRKFDCGNARTFPTLNPEALHPTKREPRVTTKRIVTTTTARIWSPSRTIRKKTRTTPSSSITTPAKTTTMKSEIKPTATTTTTPTTTTAATTTAKTKLKTAPIVKLSTRKLFKSKEQNQRTTTKKLLHIVQSRESSRTVFYQLAGTILGICLLIMVLGFAWKHLKQRQRVSFSKETDILQHINV